EIGIRLGEAPLLAQRLLQPAEIARRLVHVGLGDLDVMEAHDRIDFDRMALGALAHDLPMDLALGRHVDDQIAANFCLAAEPPAGRKGAALFGVAALDGSPWADMTGARMDRVLGEIALHDIDLAAAADAPPAADRIEINAKLARRREEACPLGEFAALAGGREDDAMEAQWLRLAVKAGRRAHRVWRARRAGGCRIPFPAARPRAQLPLQDRRRRGRARRAATPRD